MVLMRWSPLEEMNTLRDQINQIFDTPSSNGNTRSSSHLLPVEIFETSGEYTLNVMLPGINPDQVQLEAMGKKLIISAEMTPRELNAEEQVLVSEFSYGKFSRHLRFSAPIEIEKIDASWNFGLLKIKVPKTESSQRKQIEIKVSKSN